jgi:DNA helicase MCM8
MRLCPSPARFYLRLRARSSGEECLPVTTRTLESLARLTEARARAELREHATADDAADVVELMRDALGDIIFADDADGTGAGGGAFATQHGGGGGGRGGGMKGEAKRFLAALAAEAAADARSAAARGGCFSYGELVAIADRMALNVPDVETFIQRLNEVGEILMHGRLYKLRAVAVAAAAPPPLAGGGGGGGAGGSGWR